MKTERPGPSINLVFLCTGNAARSVMATTIARAMEPDRLAVSGGGTHSIEGLPMSSRTRKALKHLGLADPSHRSHQLTERDTQRADVIVAFERQNVEYVRRKHPEAATKTLTVGRATKLLPSPEQASLADRLMTMDLATVEVESWEEVIDPAGGDQDIFDACAIEVDTLLRRLLPRL